MRRNTMCKVLGPNNDVLISVKNNGDVMCFKLFSEAYAYATDVIDEELLGPIDLIEVNGTAPGRQSPGIYEPTNKDGIAKDLWRRDPFKGN